MDNYILDDYIPLLDHGYLKLIEHWGSDQSIIEAARMSTNKGFEGWGPRCPQCGNRVSDSEPGNACPFCSSTLLEGDEKLLKYLWNNKHHTPFEMAGATFEIKAPILVFREWHRHRVPFSYNEMSARYTPLPAEDYIPSIERLMINAGKNVSNKQAGTIKGSEELTIESAEEFRTALREVYHTNQILYEEALKKGVPKELARVHLPVGRYSRQRASANLRGWLAFCRLRQAPGAQWEIRQYANALGSQLQLLFPRTYELYLRSLPET